MTLDITPYVLPSLICVVFLTLGIRVNYLVSEHFPLLGEEISVAAGEFMKFLLLAQYIAMYFTRPLIYQGPWIGERCFSLNIHDFILLDEVR